MGYSHNLYKFLLILEYGKSSSLNAKSIRPSLDLDMNNPLSSPLDDLLKLYKLSPVINVAIIELNGEK